MTSPFHLRSRFRSLLSKAKGKLKREADALAYARLPLKEKTIQLAQEQCLVHAAQAFKVFGHTTLRQILTEEDVLNISTGLAEIGAGLAGNDTIITLSPVEKSRRIQRVFFGQALLDVLRELLPPFWYYGSDAFVGNPFFGKHRDTFLSPPFIKIFIPLVPCTFSVIPGSHHAGDAYARQVGRYSTEWDAGKMLCAPVSEVCFAEKGKKLVSGFLHLNPESLFVHRHLSPGDIFIFHQNAVHGLIADGDRNFFLSVSVVPSPTASVEYGLTRTQHLDRLIDNIVATAACDYQLSAQRGVDPEESLFKGYKFSDEDLAWLVANGGWHDCFGLRFIDSERWSDAFRAMKSKGIQWIQDAL